MSTQSEVVSDLQTTDGDHDLFAHYVYAPPGQDAAALVTHALIEGIPLVALCGKVWVPSRDASRFPVCPECKEIREAALGGGS